jgi:CubicO group peptidase (beta-lactamase class C family)
MHSIGPFGRSLTAALILATALVFSGRVMAHAQGTDGQESALWGEALIARVDSLAKASLENGPVAAYGIGVKKGDDVLLSTGYGWADVENQVPAKAETVFRIGSITKQFTAAAIMQLVEAGKVSLDDEITRFFPDYPTQGHTVTVRHLLTHTSGIKSYTGIPAFQRMRTRSLTDEELVDVFKDLPFDFAPGEEYRYNNSAYYLLGMVVEEVSGETYKDYVRNHIFEPLGMTGSLYCDEQPIIPWRAEGYGRRDGELVNDDYLAMSLPGAAGALCSTVPDLLTWTEALTTGQVVSPESYALMTTRNTLNDGSETGYGFGLGVSTHLGHARVAHSGGINGFSTFMAHFPEEDLDVVVLANTEGAEPGRLAEVISRWALGLEVVSVLDLPLSAEELAVYVGVYEIQPGFELSVFVDQGKLISRATGQDRALLRAQGDHVFVPSFDDQARVVFEVVDGKATKAVIHQGGGEFEAPRIR